MKELQLRILEEKIKTPGIPSSLWEEIIFALRAIFAMTIGR